MVAANRTPKNMPALGPACTTNMDALGKTLYSLEAAGLIGNIDSILIETLRSAAGNTDAAITLRDAGRANPVMVAACIKAQAALALSIYRQLVPKTGGNTDAERNIWADLSATVRDDAED